MRNDDELRTENCRIESADISIEDHGMVTFWLTLSGKGWGQGLGGWALDQAIRGGDEREGWGPGIIAIRKILETVGVMKWSQLKGTLCRAKIGYCGSARPPIIGHIIDDKWFDMDSFAKQQKDK